MLFIYGPMLVIYVLSFQGPNGGLTFPLNGVSLHWFVSLFGEARWGDVAGALERSLALGAIVTALTVLFSVMGGLAFRRRFLGSSFVLYLTIASLVTPGLVIGLGIGLIFQILNLAPSWWGSAVFAQLTWTLPFGLLVMFTVISRFDRSYEEAARDLGASDTRALTSVVLPILLPGILAVALFGFTLSYDEFARSLLTVGSDNTLPLQIWAMTSTVTSPALYALGTMTTLVSFVVIVAVLWGIAAIRRRRGQHLERSFVIAPATATDLPATAPRPVIGPAA